MCSTSSLWSWSWMATSNILHFITSSLGCCATCLQHYLAHHPSVMVVVVVLLLSAINKQFPVVPTLSLSVHGQPSSQATWQEKTVVQYSLPLSKDCLCNLWPLHMKPEMQFNNTVHPIIYVSFTRNWNLISQSLFMARGQAKKKKKTGWHGWMSGWWCVQCPCTFFFLSTSSVISRVLQWCHSVQAGIDHQLPENKRKESRKGDIRKGGRTPPDVTGRQTWMNEHIWSGNKFVNGRFGVSL